jgi:hypothetical protein
MISKSYLDELTKAGYAFTVKCQFQGVVRRIEVLDPVMCMAGQKVWRELRARELHDDQDVYNFISARE